MHEIILIQSGELPAKYTWWSQQHSILLLFFIRIARKVKTDLNSFSESVKSAIRQKMAPRVAFWVDRHVGPKFTVFVCCVGIWRQTISLENKFWTIYIMNDRVKKQDKRLYWPKLKDAAVLENI